MAEKVNEANRETRSSMPIQFNGFLLLDQEEGYEISGYQRKDSRDEKKKGTITVSIPGSFRGKPITSIGPRAFMNHREIKSISIPDSITRIENHAFSGCDYLKSISIPHGVIKIGRYAFSHCTWLKSIVIPSSVISLCFGAFFDCDSLRAIYCEAPAKPQGWYSNWNNSFVFGNIPTFWYSKRPKSGCWRYVDEKPTPWLMKNGLVFVEEGDGYAVETFLGNDTLLDSFQIPSSYNGKSITTIHPYSFRECDTSTSIKIPFNVKSVGEGTFYGCYGLSQVKIPSSITFIRKKTFQCSGLKSIEIPSSVTCIGDNAFSGCSNLTSIVIPDSVTSIGDSAFDGCFALRSIVIPDSVTSIGDKEFAWCSSLSSVTIGSHVVSIGKDTFYECNSLTSIIIPNFVTSIGDSAFDGCSALRSIVIPISVTFIDKDAFNKCNNLQTIFCEAKKKPSGWSKEWDETWFKDWEEKDDSQISRNDKTPRKSGEHWFTGLFAKLKKYFHNLRKFLCGLPECCDKTDASIYWYSETPRKDGKHWHYDSDGKTPVIWE